MAKRTFHQDLILNGWALSLFNQANLEQFKQRLGDDRFEGLSEDGQTKFFMNCKVVYFIPTIFLPTIYAVMI